MNTDQALDTDSTDEPFDYWTTPGGVYGSASDLVVEDYVTVQCPKYGYESVQHLLDRFSPVDNDLNIRRLGGGDPLVEC